MIHHLAETGCKVAIFAVAVMSWGCTPPGLGYSERPVSECNPTFGTCDDDRVDLCPYVPEGATHSLVEIGSSPTPAEIYVDGMYLGRSPLKRCLWFTSTTHAITVVAEPLYPGQARQELQLSIPPLPRRLTFFMNNPAKVDANGGTTQ